MLPLPVSFCFCPLFLSLSQCLLPRYCTYLTVSQAQRGRLSLSRHNLPHRHDLPSVTTWLELPGPLLPHSTVDTRTLTLTPSATGALGLHPANNPPVHSASTKKPPCSQSE
ncbi:hypothetical protein EXIGLDRAFT_360754 [Exidia glandulosa HHB12029]|uniref:Secreted protein n=1 Tax=Exidia glandulosa HHB12029 TaxID=1314781 RepID=A0A165C658_EXIGL|nr:hypothetical protein EXIGLDRAFT_360754 [Exidia glandulosa HHB12029]